MREHLQDKILKNTGKICTGGIGYGIAELQLYSLTDKMCDMKTKQQKSPATNSTLKPRLLTVSRRISGSILTPSCFPELRLTGRWLEQSGFESGQQVIVTCEQNLLVIRPAEIPVVEWGGEREYL